MEALKLFGALVLSYLIVMGTHNTFVYLQNNPLDLKFIEGIVSALGATFLSGIVLSGIR